MDLDRILEDLEKRFQAPYPEFYNRRIIFWMDQDKEFEFQMDSLSISDVKIIKMTENNKFYVKKQLSFDDLESDFLVYCPLDFSNKEDNWVHDIMKYSEEFRADLISIQIAEMNLPDDINIRKAVKTYKKFFNAKARRISIKKKANKITTAAHLEAAIMSEIAGCEMHPRFIIREILKSVISNSENDVYLKFKNYGVDQAFWRMVEQGTGYNSKEKSMEQLGMHIVLTAASRNINTDVFRDLYRFISSTHEAFCFEFIEEWLRNTKERDSLLDLVRYIEREINLDQRLLKLNISEFGDNEIFPAVDEVILTKLMTNIKNDIIDPDYISAIYEKRRVGAWYEEFTMYYEGLYFMGKMKVFYNKNQDSFHMIDSTEVWTTYTDKLYLMDTYYRKFQRAFQNSLRNSNSKLDDLFKYTVDRAEGIYKNWFLDKLLSNWTNVSAQELETFGHISGVKQQVEFYKDNVRGAKTKTYVIISDALRYEVAKELAVELKQDMQSQVDVDNMAGVFPTITPFGMAALLPNKGLETEVRGDTLKVLINGQSTEMSNREKVLQQANENSRVLKYDDLIHMKRDERKAQVKGMDVVYIYHDQIDSAGHTSDDKVFSASEKAIEEIKNLVKILVNEFSAVNIMVTADHGFLYTYKPFTEDDKVSQEGFIGKTFHGRRYAIMDQSATPNYLMPVKFIDEESGLKGFAPRENVRIKTNGGGLNFVHGGISLQEMVVPLIKYRHIRTDNKEYQKNKSLYQVRPVDLNIHSTARTISNMIFNLSFTQSEMLSVTREAANFVLYFIDEYGNRVSDEVRIIADRNTDNEQDRIFEVTFNLKAGNYDNRNTYKLVIHEESGQIPQKQIEFEINIPYASEGYDFFS